MKHFYSLPVFFLMCIAYCLPVVAQNVDYDAYCIATKMKHNCDALANEEGRFSVQISDNLNFSTWYRAGNGSGNMTKCLICDGDANTTNGYNCNWNILLVSKTNVSVNTLRMSFRATDDDAVTVIDDWWMDDDCTYTLSGQDVVLSSLTAGLNNDLVVGQSTDPQWYVTYRIYYEYVAVNVPATPVADQNPSCGPTWLVALPSTQPDVTWYWQGTSPNGTSTANPSSAAFTVDTTGIYYLRAKGNSNNVWSTASSSVYVEVKTGSTTASGINVTNNNTPQGTVKTLSIIGGSLGTGAGWQWYTEPACSNLVGTGDFVDVDPPATHAYYARAEGDCDTTLTVSTTVVVAAAGVEALELNGGILRFYPNPVNELLFININKPTESMKAGIYDIYGKLQLQQALTQEHSSLSLESLSAGVYMIVFSDSEKYVCKKLIKY